LGAPAIIQNVTSRRSVPPALIDKADLIVDGPRGLLEFLSRLLT
jgi:hypothetical protein